MILDSDSGVVLGYHKVYRLVFTGLLENQSPVFLSVNDVISTYNFVKGKQYDAWRDGGMYFIVDNYGSGQPMNISLQLLNLYFKSLSDIRSNKLTELGI
jgi:hypothetical protein